MEHNIQVLSKIYLNISFEQLGKFLDIQTEKAEAIIGDMVIEQRIQAQLDQQSQTIDFEMQTDTKASHVFGGQSISAAEGAGKPIDQ